LLGPTVAVARWLGGAVMAFGASQLAAAGARSTSDASPAPATATPTGTRHVSWLSALSDWLDHQTAWLALGLLLAAALEAGLAPQLLTHVAPPWDVPLAALLALPVYFGALGLTPIALVLLHKGASLGAVLTLSWISPVASLPVLGWLRHKLGLRVAWRFGVGCVLLATALGLAASSLLSTANVPAVHPLLAHRHGVGEIACACLLGGLSSLALLRRGPRGLYAAMWAEHHQAADAGAASLPDGSPRLSRPQGQGPAELERDGVG